MTSKTDERKALEQIKAIIEKLGNDSYIGTAFDGCIELAEQNIDDDAAYSARWYINKTYELENQLKTNDQENKKNIENIKKEYDELKKGYEVLRNSREEIKNCSLKYWNDLCKAQNKIDDLELEIIKLKAKLYDAMTK